MRMGIVHMCIHVHVHVWQRDKNPNWMKMSAQGYPLVFNERQGNPHTTVQAAASPKTYFENLRHN